MPDTEPMALETGQSETPATEPMSLDDSVVETDSTPAKDVDGIPYCRAHHCRMKQKSGGKKGSRTAYYSCPVPGCGEKSQMIKTKHPGVVPPQPLVCARCSDKKKKVYCERDKDCSTAAAVILRCPSCGWKSNTMAVPQLAAAHFSRQSTMLVSGVGDR